MPTIRPLKGKIKRKRFLAYDLEWYPHTLKLRLIGVYDGGAEAYGKPRYRCYYSVSDFLDGELTSENRGALFYAHAGGLFDVQFILEDLAGRDDHNAEVQAIFSGSSAIIVKIRKGKNTWKLLDSYWLLRQPLRAIGSWMGLTKGGESVRRPPCEYSSTGICTCDPIFFSPLPALKAYNEQDCKILWKAIDYFQNFINNLGGNLEVTASSTALALFRRRYLKREIRTLKSINEVARKAYIASRVEVFSPRCEEASDWDINSSFPYAMTYPLPGNLIRTRRGIPSGDGAIYLAHADVTVPDSIGIPPLPFRPPESSRVFFPVGSWRGWFTSIDLEALEESGGKIDRVHLAHQFEPFSDLADFARDIYERRKDAESPAEKGSLKIVLNGGYGKFAERGVGEKIWINPESPKRDDPLWDMVSPGIWRETQIREVKHQWVPIAAHITARARRNLGRYLSECDPVYCDTDGFSAPRQYRWPDSRELGRLKHVRDIRKGFFVAPKLYAVLPEGGEDDPDPDWIVKAKGFRQLTYPQFCDLVEGRTVEIEGMQKIREGLRSRAEIRPHEVRISKGLRNKELPKRCSEGRQTRPWTIEEIAENYWDILEEDDPGEWTGDE